MKYSYYPGCTLRNKAKDLDEYARASARALGFELEEIEDWQCCGGVYPLGTDEIATKLSSVRALNQAKEKGQDLVTICSACHHVIKRVNDDMKNVEDIRTRANNYMQLDEPYAGETTVLHYLEVLRDRVGFDKLKEKVVNPETVKIEVRGNTLPYVSRGGLKLEKAMKNFDVTLDSKVCMDVGASTGGFTDCMLQNGAVKVYSIDVGYGQLDWKLRNDPRVVCMEKTNIRYVVPEDLGEPADFSSIDVSFISLTKVLLPVRNLLTDEGEIVCLIKPQFEAGREKVGKKGVVRDPAVHQEVIEKVRDYAMSIFMEPCHLSFSPIKGPEGNIEYLLHLKKHPEGTGVTDSLKVSVEAVVAEAHGQLD